MAPYSRLKPLLVVKSFSTVMASSASARHTKAAKAAIRTRPASASSVSGIR